MPLTRDELLPRDMEIAPAVLTVAPQEPLPAPALAPAPNFPSRLL